MIAEVVDRRKQRKVLADESEETKSGREGVWVWMEQWQLNGQWSLETGPEMNRRLSRTRIYSQRHGNKIRSTADAFSSMAMRKNIYSTLLCL